MLTPLLLCCIPQAPASAPAIPLPLTIVRGAFREVAGAQVPLPAFTTDGDVRRTSLTHRGRSLGIVVDTADPPTRLWLDADGDGKRGAGEELRLAFDDAFAEVDLAPFDVDAQLVLFRGPAGLKAIVRTRYHFAGELADGDRRLGVRWIDMDGDGAPSTGDRWMALPIDHLDRLALSNSMFAAHEVSEPWHFDTRELRVAIGSDGKVAARWSAPQRPRAEFLAARHERLARWFAEGFELDRAEFEREHGIDPKRPQGTPVDWYHTCELADALAFAQRTGKPLLVEWSNDACPWCKRLPWSTYRDRAVIERLQDFACVRINPDLEPTLAATTLGLKGVPNLTLLGADGALLDTVGGYSPPVPFAKELDRLRTRAGLAPIPERGDR